MTIPHTRRFALASLLVAAAASAWALSAKWTYLAQLPLPAATSGYGRSVALSGSYGLAGSNQGADLFFRPPPNTPLPPHLWLHVQHFSPRAGTTGLFGRAVAIDGDRLAIGAPYGDPQLVNNGYVDLYERTNSGWTYTQTVTATAFDPPPPLHPELEFGLPIVLKGDTLVVGARHYYDTAGRVFVFERNGGLFQQTQQLKPAVDVRETSFGSAIALSGDTLAIGRGGAGGAGSGPNGEDEPLVAGEVHVYVRSGGVFALQQVLVAPDAVPADRFGQSLDLQGNRLVVRSRTAVHLFGRAAGVWTAQWQLAVPEITAIGSSSNATVALRPSPLRYVEDDLFVGHPGASPSRLQQNAGSVLRFTGVAGGPGFIASTALQDPSPTAGARFGSSLAGSGELLLVGAPSTVSAEARARVYSRLGVLRPPP